MPWSSSLAYVPSSSSLAVIAAQPILIRVEWSTVVLQCPTEGAADRLYSRAQVRVQAAGSQEGLWAELQERPTAVAREDRLLHLLPRALRTTDQQHQVQEGCNRSSEAQGHLEHGCRVCDAGLPHGTCNSASSESQLDCTHARWPCPTQVHATLAITNLEELTNEFVKRTERFVQTWSRKCGTDVPALRLLEAQAQLCSAQLS